MISKLHYGPTQTELMLLIINSVIGSVWVSLKDSKSQIQVPRKIPIRSFETFVSLFDLVTSFKIKNWDLLVVLGVVNSLVNVFVILVGIWVSEFKKSPHHLPFDFLNSVYPHLPQEFLSLCSAKNTPSPHLGQYFLLSSTVPFLTSKYSCRPINNTS